MRDYSNHFRFEKKHERIKKYNYYNWTDQYYRNFMVELLKNLQPRMEEKDIILFNELDDVTEILFLNKGQIDIGFEINRKKHFVLRQRQKLIVGDQECTFN